NKAYQAVVCLRLEKRDGAESAFKRWMREWLAPKVTYTDKILAARRELRQRVQQCDRPPRRAGQRAGDESSDGNGQETPRDSPWHCEPMAESWHQVAFSYDCLTRLTPLTETAFADRAFRKGMAERREILGDAPESLVTWEIGGLDPDKRADVFLLLAHDHEDAVKNDIADVANSLVDYGVPAVAFYQEIGHLVGPHDAEHFGYKADGASQPGIRGKLPDPPGGVL